MINGAPLLHQDKANELLDAIRTEPLSTPVLIYFDPDVDGLFAGKFWVDWCKKNSISYETYVNPNRTHGFLLPPERVAGRTILSGDFMVPVEQFRDLIENHSVRWLHTDHHSYDEGSLSLDNGVYINPQAICEPQRAEQSFQSGAGVVLDVLSHYDSSFGSPEYIAQVGITLLTDVRPLDNPEARAILETLYTIPYDGYFRYLLNNTYKVSRDYGYGVPEANRTFVDSKFSPLMNSLFRFNHGDTAIRFVCEDIRSNDRVLLSTVPAKQRTLIKQAQYWGKSYDFEDARLVKFDIADVPLDYQDVIGNYLGMLASRHSDDKSTLVMMTSNGRVLRASFRGKYEGIDYRSALEKSMGIPCLGHTTAFGVKFSSVEKLDSQVFVKYAETVNSLESVRSSSSSSRKVIKTMLDDIDLIALARENDYHDRQNMTYLQYVGPWSISNQRPTVIRYSCAGHEVLSFSHDLTPSNAVIQPRYDRNSVTLILSHLLES